jgi:hypothetical protein
VILRIAFAIVIICHIPYVYFSAKESILTIIDEWDRQSISSSLGMRLCGMPIIEEQEIDRGTLLEVGVIRLSNNMIGFQAMN